MKKKELEKILNKTYLVYDGILTQLNIAEGRKEWLEKMGKTDTKEYIQTLTIYKCLNIFSDQLQDAFYNKD